MKRVPKALVLLGILRNRCQKLRVPLALLYLVLSMAAAWHHHAERPDLNAAAQVAAASETPGAPADLDGFCVLCAWQSLQQQTASGTPAVSEVLSLVPASAPSAPTAPTPGFSQASWARGPPSV